MLDGHRGPGDELAPAVRGSAIGPGAVASKAAGSSANGEEYVFSSPVGTCACGFARCHLRRRLATVRAKPIRRARQRGYLLDNPEAKHGSRGLAFRSRSRALKTPAYKAPSPNCATRPKCCWATSTSAAHGNRQRQSGQLADRRSDHVGLGIDVRRHRAIAAIRLVARVNVACAFGNHTVRWRRCAADTRRQTAAAILAAAAELVSIPPGEYALGVRRAAESSRRWARWSCWAGPRFRHDLPRPGRESPRGFGIGPSPGTRTRDLRGRRAVARFGRIERLLQKGRSTPVLRCGARPRHCFEGRRTSRAVVRRVELTIYYTDPARGESGWPCRDGR